MIAARTLKTGKRVYDVRLRDPNGKQYNKTFATKREARVFEDAERTAHRCGNWIDPRHGSVTVAELATR